MSSISEVVAPSKPTLLDLGIAVAAGGISGFAKVQPKVSGTLAGTAIAVALMPPICVIGLGLSQGNWSLSLGATLLYLTNLLGITLSCMLTFLIAGYTPLKRARKPLSWALAFTAILLLRYEYPHLQKLGTEKLQEEMLAIEADTYAEFVRAGRLSGKLSPLLQEVLVDADETTISGCSIRRC